MRTTLVACCAEKLARIAPARELASRAYVSIGFAYPRMPGMVEVGIAEEREVTIPTGKRREYRRAR